MYDVAEPGPDLSADFAEELWRQYEGALSGAIKALESGSYTQGDWLTVLLHVQAQSMRHPDFARAVHEHVGPVVAATLSADDIQAERQRTFQGTRAWMAGARFALLRHRVPAQRFLANDKGYVPLHDVMSDVRGVVFPLSGRVAVLMVVGAARPGDDYEQGPLVERTLNPKGMEIVNAASWDTVGIKCVIGHPDDQGAIAALCTGERTVSMPALGPYRGNREPAMFDWACPGLRLAVRRPRSKK